MDSKQQKETPTDGGGERSGSGRSNDGKGENDGRGMRESSNSAGGKGLTDDDPEAIEKLINLALNRELILLYLRYFVYDSPVPASFVRSLPLTLPIPSSPFSLPDRKYKCDEIMVIVATSEIGKGSAGTALRGTLEPHDMDAVTPLDAVLKFAFEDWQRDSLKSEYEVYLLLKSKGVHQGITTVLGHFEDVEGSACALVMLYAGVPISDVGRKLTISECDSALSTLESIHSAGVIHGAISSDNVLIGHSGVTIIDFAHAEQSSSLKAKKREYAYLRFILQDLAGED